MRGKAAGDVDATVVIDDGSLTVIIGGVVGGDSGNYYDRAVVYGDGSR